ncbi:hypothetical protein [Methanosarcina sp.]
MAKLVSYSTCLEYSPDLEVGKGFVVMKNCMHEFENTVPSWKVKKMADK